MQTIYELVLCFNPESFRRASLSFPALISSQESLVVLWQSFLSLFMPFRKPSVFALHVVRHIFEISDDSRMRITTKTVHDRNDDFALRYVRIYPGINSRAELVTLA